MKKLLTILVILMMVLPMIGSKEKLTDLFDFNASFGASASDNWNPGDNNYPNTSDAQSRWWMYYGFKGSFGLGTSLTVFEGDILNIGVSLSDSMGFSVGDANFNDVFTTENNFGLTTSFAIAEIYTLSLGVSNAVAFRPFSNLDFARSAEEQFKLNNVIKLDETVVGADLNKDGDQNDTEVYVYDADANGIYTAGETEADDISFSDNFINWRFTRFHFTVGNSISIPDIMTLGLNLELALFQNDDNTMSWQGYDTNTNMTLGYNLSLGGSYDFGLSWSLANEIKIGLNLSKWKDNDPEDDGTIIQNGSTPTCFRSLPLIGTSLGISQEVLGLAGIDNVTLTISLDDLLLIHVPYSVGDVEATRFQNNIKAGANLGVKGFSFGLYLIAATQNTYDPDTAYAGHNTGADDAYSGRQDDRAQLGFMFTLGFSANGFNFGFTYVGQGQLMDYDYNRDNFQAVIAADTEYDYLVDGGGLFRQFKSYHRWSNLIELTVGYNW
jgi:hypothetical protein